MPLRPLRWDDGSLEMLDQRVLPGEEKWIRLATVEDVAEAIRDMAVRGAPAIGVTAAYGLVLAAQAGRNKAEAIALLAASRPTAVNLFYALDRIDSLPTFEADQVLDEARKIESEDLECNQSIGRHGQSLVSVGATILTICNTGSLATSGHGTALGIIRTAHDLGKQVFVYSCETRPRQQGLKLTAWELLHEKIPFRVIVDSAAASLMRAGAIDLVIAGADRIARNGDTANKIGTYSLAVLAHHHKIPFYIAAPMSTFDLSIGSGAEIPIEERSPREITHQDESEVAPHGCPVFNPAFDVTPGDLITGFVTERGIHKASEIGLLESAVK